MIGLTEFSLYWLILLGEVSSIIIRGYFKMFVRLLGVGNRFHYLPLFRPYELYQTINLYLIDCPIYHTVQPPVFTRLAPISKFKPIINGGRRHSHKTNT